MRSVGVEGGEHRFEGTTHRANELAARVKLFGFGAEFESLKKLGQDLINKGEKMYYHRDLSWLFRD